ncbi:voltage-dependent calcium channel unc-36 [Plakobranchus ocellatus]|uniref:Voltage-dependent calcium channel unc-36 n=1 Tax=Plakobranchus ocellatus TaxID=259542 RepID=A0AAV4CPM7_9GAST|nr:voltage-dependent calcium channel unc-36 [Plakobranchus ocellatus]
MRGQHQNRPHKLQGETSEAIIQHIKSFRGRKSHYAIGATRKVYLPDSLSVTKMHRMFMCSHPPHMEVSYETYRQIFTTKFNIGFGYPRKDTCSVCDEFQQKIDCKEREGDSGTRELQTLLAEREIHQRKADTFFKRKNQAKDRARSDTSTEAVVFDFQKNLHAPNKTSNDIYYKRQLTCISFNIHILSTDDVFFYCYDETTTKKGADEVCSMLHHFTKNFISPEVRRLELFCDGCSGQNKNYTLLRFLHFLVHTEKRFTSISLRFPV